VTAAERVLADPTEALRLVKPSVRLQGAYTLAAPVARHKINQNEAPADLDADLKAEILRRAAARPWHRYPEFAPRSLVERLASHYDCDPDGLLVGNGSNELIQATLGVTLDRDDVLVAPAPTFSLYRLLAAVHGAHYVGVPFARDFRYDMARLLRTVARDEAKVLVLNTPNNPTGSVLTRADVERALDAFEGLVVCDEAYVEFGGETAIPLLARHPRLVVLRTFSKALGLAGLRFGVAIAHPQLAREIAKAKLPYNVNLITLDAAEVVLDHADRIADRVTRIVAAREALIAALRALPGLVVFESAANFVVIRCEAVPAKRVFQRLLEEFGILIRDVSAGVDLEECLRISIGTDDDMAALLQALQTIFGEAA
jgi:histidinol-phosphate aminotransferase